jgi:hypothetical protein
MSRVRSCWPIMAAHAIAEFKERPVSWCPQICGGLAYAYRVVLGMSNELPRLGRRQVLAGFALKFWCDV